VLAGMVHSHDPMKSIIQAPDSHPLEAGFCKTVRIGSPPIST
jgi:hypothetical protein